MERRAECHPDRKHYGLGLCARCYDRHRTSKPEVRKKILAALRESYKDPEVRERRLAANRKYYQENEEFRERRKKQVIERKRRLSV